jgi:tRNA (cytidine/uridine-2'-O-)-methyltransferase
MQLVAYQPDIPQNVGALTRLAACFATPLHIIEPCGFLLTDRALKRAALDYGGLARVIRHDSWGAFLAGPDRIAGRLVLLTTRGATRLDAFAFTPSDLLLLGRESAGVPETVHSAADARVVIPLAAGARSLNVAMAGAIALAEAHRQTGWRLEMTAAPAVHVDT